MNIFGFNGISVGILCPVSFDLIGLKIRLEAYGCTVCTLDTDLMSAIKHMKEEKAQVVVIDGRTEFSANSANYVMGAFLGESIPLIGIGIQPAKVFPYSDGVNTFPREKVDIERRELQEALGENIDPSSPGDQLLLAMEKAVANLRPAVQPRRGRGRPRMVTAGYELSKREYDIALLIAKGYTNQKIAEESALKEQSVKNLVSTVIRKLHCENRVQVALRLSHRSE